MLLTMARHYYRTNIPFGAQLLWWGFCGICILVYGCYNALFIAPEQDAKVQAQRQWDRNRFNGWRLERSSYATDDDIRHGLFYDKLELKTCTTMAFPGYPACPAQAYFLEGTPQTVPANSH